MSETIRLGVNIDHVATIRNARDGSRPDPYRAALIALAAGADGITAHLREDRRHIRDDDVARLIRDMDRPLNLEMAAIPEMVERACRLRPHAVCIVPERREERTTEGGLAVVGQHNALRPVIAMLADAGVRVSLFIEPDREALQAAAELGAPVVELHTGTWCDALMRNDTLAADAEFRRIEDAAVFGGKLGLEIHAGHGLDYDSAEAISALPQIAELNIGHFLVGEAIFVGLEASIRAMRSAIDRGAGQRVASVS